MPTTATKPPATTTLFGWGPIFDTPSPSPFVMKSEMQLQMLGVPFERALADLESVNKHKAPYVRDAEQVVEDSTFIRAHFERKLGKSLDAELSVEQGAAAWAVERMLEDRLYFIMVQERWLEADNFRKGPMVFFSGVPEAVRAQVCEDARNGLRAMLVRHGIARHSRSERMLLAARDIAAVASLLGDKLYLFGAAPSAVDAAAFGVLAGAGTRFFDSQLPDLIEAHSNLRPYLRRIEERFFAVSHWPAMFRG